MRLSDIKADRYDEVMAAVPELIENLAKNETFNAMMFRGDLDASDLKAAQKKMTERISEYLPKLMTSAKKELVEYFALLDDVSADEYAKNLTIGSMFNGIEEILKDKVFLNFFALYQTHTTE